MPLTYVKQASDQITGVTSIAHRLKKARMAANLSQAELARQAGVSSGTVGNIEAGARQDPQQLVELAIACGVRPEWLRLGEEPMKYPAAPATPAWPPTPASPLTPTAVANALCDLIERLDDGARERVWGRLSTAAHAPDSQDARAKLAAELQPLTPPTRLTPTPAPAPAPLSQKQHRTGTK